MMIGATMPVLIRAYDVQANRTLFQSVAFAAVCGMISLMIAGYPLEIISSSCRYERLGALLSEKLPQNEACNPGYSEVRPWVALLFWLASSAVYYFVDRQRIKLRASAASS
jgi:uncharacterized BrkB/YihY/UPF0761 family membrane protein